MIVENVAEKDRYLTSAEHDDQILSLKGLFQVLIQKNLFVPSPNLIKQWDAALEKKAMLISQTRSEGYISYTY